MPLKVHLVFVIVLVVSGSASAARSKRKPLVDLACIDNGKFYRNPTGVSNANLWSPAECGKYYLCLDEEVFEFKCSEGLLFDISRQICDFQANVDNCDIGSAAAGQPVKPLLTDSDCAEKELACGDASCFPASYFCDGNVDCPDGSDESWCAAEEGASTGAIKADEDRKEEESNGSLACDQEKCHPPNCWCSKDGRGIPGNFSASLVPQMIMISFDNAVNAENIEIYSKIFTDQRRNPNGCPIRGTFYISHQYTNYRDVQYLWNSGHEIAVHSITHRGPEEWWSRNATIEDWFDEMVGLANIIKRYAAVRLHDIKGLRVPFLRVGWNRQFLMMSEFGFTYDSSIVVPFSDPPLWPYSLEYRIPHTCRISGQLCPTRSYPSIWELPLNQLLAGEYTCATLDSCPSELSGEDVYQMLIMNFKRHYLSNRAPLGLHLKASWLRNPMYFDAFTKFLDETLRLNDVYFLTSQRVIEWMRHPTPLGNIDSFQPWQCSPRQYQQHEIACQQPNSCKLPSRVLRSYRYLHTCFECPKEYPWLRNEFGATP